MMREELERWLRLVAEQYPKAFDHRPLRSLNDMDRRLTLYEAYQRQRQANNRLSDLRRQRLSLILELGATLYPQGKKAFQAGDIRRELMLDQQRSVPAHEHWHLLEMRCVSLLAHILSRDAREEWLGDLQEARRELIASRYTWWAVSLITWGRVVLLGWSLIKIKYQDLGFSKKRQRE